MPSKPPIPQFDASKFLPPSDPAQRAQLERDADLAIVRCRISLLFSTSVPTFAFLSRLITMLRLKPSWDAQTAATDGYSLIYNPAFMLSLSSSDLRGIIIHETLHCALLHHTRMRACPNFQYEKDLHNVAMDFVINHMIREFPSDHNTTIPDWACFADHPDFGFPVGLAYEEYLPLLRAKYPPDKSGPSPLGQPRPGDVAEPGTFSDPSDPSNPSGPGDPSQPQPSEATTAQSEIEWQQALVDAAQQAANHPQAGNMPGSMARLVTSLTKPRVHWRSILRRFLTGHLGRKDYSWAKFNRSYYMQGLMQPALASPTPVDIIILFDTSGSIGTEEINTFASEIQGILRSHPSTRVHIAYHDTNISSVQTWSPKDGPLQLKPTGGGGTDHCRPYAQLVSDVIPNLENPKCIVNFTDGYTTYPDPSITNLPSIWVMTSSQVAPFGTTIPLTP